MLLWEKVLKSDESPAAGFINDRNCQTLFLAVWSAAYELPYPGSVYKMRSPHCKPFASANFRCHCESCH
ncbi:Ribonuclease PH [Frankliniella fusca]|uniref:Ribonuclease PH n=1 Tax=Frankliniella fusca TaxID=407009 RepID=A0AAE1HPZ1_9NEOP|nr:Ribonuclease PH [Frankliniella fusca]